MVVRDLGFRAVLVLVLVVLPAIGLLIRRKWRHAAARKEEIRLLLALASEEAARAEFEASIEYAASSTAAAVNPVPSTVTSQRYCAVCYSPTTSRCRRCKSVRYCSSKCQVIHWRQGHKHECSPSLINHEINDEGSNLASEQVKQNQNDGLTSKSAEEESESESDSSVVHAQNSPWQENVRSHHVRDESILEPKNSGDFASSPVSSPSAVHKIFDDSSVLKDEDSHKLRGMSRLANNHDPFVDAKNFEQANSSSTSAFEIETDHNVPQSDNTKSESQCISTSASDCDENSVPEPAVASSGFWDGYLESSITIKSTQSGSAETTYDGLIDKNASGSRSIHRSPLDFSGESSSDLYLKGSELSNHTFAKRRQSSKPGVKVATLSGKEAKNSSSSGDSVLLTSAQPISSDKGTNNGSNGRKSKEARHSSSRTSLDPSIMVEDRSAAAKVLKDHDSYDSGRSKHVNSAVKVSSQLSVSKKAGAPQNISNGLSPSDANKHSTSALKPVQTVNDSRSVGHNQMPNVLPTRSVKDNLSRSSKLSRYSTYGVGSGSSAQNTAKVLFPYELFVKLYNWKEVELRPCGLINCGNSCYANAVLQCLTFTPPLTAYLLQAFHSKTCAKKDWCFTCEFERLILSAKKGGAPLSPISILSHIEKIGSHLTNGREEDAHEFMRYAIDTMQSICLREAVVSGTKCLEEETTLLGLTFGGYLRSKIRCMKCHGKSEQHERMMDLTVEIEGNIETLEEALRKFTGVEILDGENKYQCSRCNSYEKAKKRLTIYEAPNVLTIALKRFQAGKFGKLNKSIRFPDVLDLAPYMRGASDKSPIYRLYGVIVHLDIMNATFSGHYICYVRNAQNKWFKIDDSMVKAVEMDSVLKEGAYMLFYSRYSPRAPRSIRDFVVSRDIVNKGKPPESKSSSGIDTKNRGSSLRGGQSFHTNQAPPRSPNDNASPEAGFSPNKIRFNEADTSSETSSIFSHSEGTSTTDSNQESSTSTDDFLDHIFGEGVNNHYSYWRNPLDSDTSSSSSTSSSPLYMARTSPLSSTERYASASSVLIGFGNDNAHSDMKGGGGREVSILQADDNMKQCRKLVNSSGSGSSCRETDSSGKSVGWSKSNPSSNRAKSGVYLR